MPEHTQILVQKQDEQVSGFLACVSRLRLLTYAAVKYEILCLLVFFFCFWTLQPRFSKNLEDFSGKIWNVIPSVS